MARTESDPRAFVAGPGGEVAGTEPSSLRALCFGVQKGPFHVQLAIRIDRDTAGRGFPDTFEHFDIVDDQAILARREKDMTGDREIDVVSIYHEGRLVRREIADPALLPAL